MTASQQRKYYRARTSSYIDEICYAGKHEVEYVYVCMVTTI